jgi:hypothetical protein
MMRAIHLRRAEAFQCQVRRDLEHEIAEEEDPGAETVSGRGKAQVLVHRKRGKTHIHPVEVGDEVADDQERHEPRGELPDRASFQFVHEKCNADRSSRFALSRPAAAAPRVLTNAIPGP